MPRLLELFCGTKSIGKEFERVGFEVVSVDVDPRFKPTICADILDLAPASFGYFDAVWASPPCNSFSIAVIGKNWNYDRTPKHPRAELGLKILQRTKDIVKAVNPKMFWYENPRGGMKWFMEEFQKETVTYCQYGDTRMKPTNIWHNTGWTPRPICKNGDTCHDAAPRGSKTGTQGIKGSRDRAVIPAALCRELAEYAHRRLVTPHIAEPIRGQYPLFA